MISAKQILDFRTKQIRIMFSRHKFLCAADVFVVIQVLAAVGFMFFTSLDQIRSEPLSKQNQLKIEEEFRAVQHPPRAQPTSTNLQFTRKSHQGIVGLSYQTDLSYPEIRSYYDVELYKHGWEFKYEEKFKPNGQDTIQAVYCKDKYKASIYYKGNGGNDPQ
jgi:hypothetical protein